MAASTVILAVLLLAVLSSVDATNTQQAQCTRISTRQIHSLFDQFQAAWKARDAARTAALFTRDALALPTRASIATTYEEIERYFAGFLRLSPRGVITKSQTFLGCNLAYRTGLWTFFTTGRPIQARFTFIYRPEDGIWKMSHIHSSVVPSE
jgi:uncharacterized protein (TIGR02246 family)